MSPPNQTNEPWYRRHPELFGLSLLLLAVSELLSLCSFQMSTPQDNLFGLFGHGSALILYTTLGLAAYPAIVVCGWIGIKTLIQGETIAVKRLFAYSIALFSLSLAFTLVGILFPTLEVVACRFFGFQEMHLGGSIVYGIYKKLPYVNLEALFNRTGTLVVALCGLILSIGYLLEFRLQTLLAWLVAKYMATKKILKSSTSGVRTEKRERESSPLQLPEKKGFQGIKKPALLEHAIEIPQTVINIPEPLPVLQPRKVKPSPVGSGPATSPEGAKLPQYAIPSHELLNPPKKHDTTALKGELKKKAEQLEETLMSFGIEAKVGNIHSGPTITSFEVHPAIGVKVGRIKTLEHDIALNLEAKSIRIVAPIPGKAAVGIEIPNNTAQEVSFKELLHVYTQQAHPLHIPMLLGKTVSGDLVIHDLVKMPHMIIAGATGSGKSVCINSIIMSILLTSTPDMVKLLMIDPKKVELTPYTELPHMLAPVICDPKNACSALNWLVGEMEKRYEILRLTGQRHIDAFNKRKVDPDFEKSLDIPIPAKLPYYVAIIDELADLMMVASSDIETPIARIAQMARAVGIHLILATQRPSREVITGLIKANFPARLSFKVASRVNSQIILDDIGAETLLGNGDMLFLPPGNSSLIRAQGVFIRDEEINRVIEAITKQLPPQYIISSFDKLPEEGGFGMEGGGEPGDSLFEEAKNIVFSTGNASTTFLQRKLKIGYARAASLMDELEKKGHVGPQEGSKPRTVYYSAAPSKLGAAE